MPQPTDVTVSACAQPAGAGAQARHGSSDAAGRRALRTIATLEAVKGVVALMAGLGLLGLLHHDLHHAAVSLIGHVGLNPGERYPEMLLSRLDLLAQQDFQWLILAVAAYAALRFAEAWGLWKGRAWGEALGALSGGLYIPFEVWHWLHRPSLAATVVIAFNAAVVGYLAWRLRRRPAEAASPA
ncbi:DUF2127 domain-containing protein [Paracidovorax cattleyae]|uniref:Uncharacterized membrane protein, DUF2068 family n=1 Tax=Paracidovorax cattleyae TaxID=80868 RepID=A0A1H0WH55_9BURK|nr:DUF2127 domain-containing protein [Paracidovorax cattleyae]SDP89903.1 Uncharacterized membrane protein, DUF2068 family [Paracidovorax cattleyae]